MPPSMYNSVMTQVSSLDYDVNISNTGLLESAVLGYNKTILVRLNAL
jgi:hypothetical protein